MERAGPSIYPLIPRKHISGCLWVRVRPYGGPKTPRRNASGTRKPNRGTIATACGKKKTPLEDKKTHLERVGPSIYPVIPRRPFSGCRWVGVRLCVGLKTLRRDASGNQKPNRGTVATACGEKANTSPSLQDREVRFNNRPHLLRNTSRSYPINSNLRHRRPPNNCSLRFHPSALTYMSRNEGWPNKNTQKNLTRVFRRRQKKPKKKPKFGFFFGRRNH